MTGPDGVMRPGLAPESLVTDEGPGSPERTGSSDPWALIRSAVEVYRTPDGEPYARIVSGSSVMDVDMATSQFADALRYLHMSLAEEPPTENELRRHTRMFEALARRSPQVHTVGIRIAEGPDGAIYVDRGPGADSYVRITREGYDLVQDVPVRFVRPDGMLTLPVPSSDGSVDALRPFVRVASEDDFRLIVGYLVAAYRCRPPHWILSIRARQGGAKTTTARVIAHILHPEVVDTREPPTTAHDLVLASRESPLLILDNLSVIKSRLSDDLCRLSTGMGSSKRTLRTNLDQTRTRTASRVIITGIEDLLERDDLRERGIMLELAEMTPQERLTEEEFWPRFREALPCILGGFYGAVAGALARKDLPRPPRLPRMADPTMFVVRAEAALGWSEGSFLAAYARNREESIESVVEYDAVAPYIRDLAREHGTWVGTATELLVEIRTLRRQAGDLAHQSIRSAAALGRHLERIRPALDEMGIATKKFKDTDRNKTRLVAISSNAFTGLEEDLIRRKKGAADQQTTSGSNGPTLIGRLTRALGSWRRPGQRATGAS